jgi:hypothetical protein
MQEDGRMPDLDFKIEGAEPVAFAATPLIALKLRVSQHAEAAQAVPIHTVVLRCQIRIEPAKRRYESSEKARLLDLFDTPDRWSHTLRPMLWTHVNAVVPPFSDSVTLDLPVPCSFDFNLAATKYFYALEEGELPLCLLFSGTVFHESDEAGLQAAQISWEKEATFRLPVQVWKEMMERYYPNSAWLCLRRDVFDRLYRYKSRRGLPTWEQALEKLLTPEERGDPP